MIDINIAIRQNDTDNSNFSERKNINFFEFIYLIYSYLNTYTFRYVCLGNRNEWSMTRNVVWKIGQEFIYCCHGPHKRSVCVSIKHFEMKIQFKLIPLKFIRLNRFIEFHISKLYNKMQHMLCINDTLNDLAIFLYLFRFSFHISKRSNFVSPSMFAPFHLLSILYFRSRWYNATHVWHNTSTKTRKWIAEHKWNWNPQHHKQDQNGSWNNNHHDKKNCGA